MLKVENLYTKYGAIEALKGISFEVGQGQVVALVGANGAGKSTMLNTLSGLLKPAGGKITFDGLDITGWRADRVTAAGLVQVPEGRAMLAPLTVAENLLMGAFTRKNRDGIASDLEKIFQRFPRLTERRDQAAGLLSGGEQQMLAIGRALMANPRLLMLDEPSMGLAPLIVNDVFSILTELKDQGKTILLVEQNAKKALAVADYAYVLDRGRIVRDGPGQVLRDDAAIVQAYLGG
jgi:branched-chain amino acid transport system ATP-binding protein